MNRHKHTRRCSSAAIALVSGREVWFTNREFEGVTRVVLDAAGTPKTQDFDGKER